MNCFHVLDDAADLLRAHENSDTDIAADFALQVSKLVVRSEVLSVEVNDADSMSRAVLWRNIVDDRLLVVLETTAENVPIRSAIW